MSDSDIYQHIMDIKHASGQTKANIESMQVQMKEHIENHEQGETQIKSTINELTSRVESIPDESHKEHHAFVRALIARQNARTELMNTVTNEIAKKGAWAGICMASYMLWVGANHFFIKTKGGPG